jgi:MFS family permease
VNLLDDIDPTASVDEKNTRQDGPLFTRAYLLLIGIQLTFGFSFSTFFLLPKFLTVELHSTPDLVGAIAAVGVIVSVLVVPFLGPMLDRSRRQPLILLGALTSAAASFGFMWVESVAPPIFILRALHGVAFALAFNAAATLVAEHAPPARLSQALGIFGAASLSTNALAPALGEAIAERSGWTPVFGLAAITSTIAAGLSFLVREEPRSKADRPLSTAGSGAHAALSSPSRSMDGFAHAFSGNGGRILYVCGVSGAAFGVVFTFIAPFALELGQRHVASFFIGYTVAAIVVRIVFGNAADRYGRRNVALVGLTLYGVIVLAMSALTPGLLILFGAVFGVAHGLFYPALNALAIAGSDPSRRGTVMTYFNGAFNAGFAVSVIPCGLIAHHYGYSAVFLLAGLTTLNAVRSLAKL